jgi:hypothetical protein
MAAGARPVRTRPHGGGGTIAAAPDPVAAPDGAPGATTRTSAAPAGGCGRVTVIDCDDVVAEEIGGGTVALPVPVGSVAGMLVGRGTPAPDGTAGGEEIAAPPPVAAGAGMPEVDGAADGGSAPGAPSGWSSDGAGVVRDAGVVM